MSTLTQQEKELCVVFIKNLYNNSFPVSTKDITPKVAKLVEEMLNKISNCSTAVAGVHAVYSSFYGKVPLNLTWIIRQLRNSAGKTMASWIKMLLSERRYQMCINTVAWNYKTKLQEAVIGI